MEDMRNAHKILFGKPEGKRQLGRPSRGYEIMFRHLREIGCEGVNWVELARDGV
jgi:hypothetical protein